MRRTRIPYGPGHGQVGDLWLPSKTTGVVPLVVLIHGGFWRAQYTKTLMNRLARAVARRGWAAWNIEYRRVGALGGGGGWPATFQDVADAIDHVQTFPAVDSGRVVTCGHSAGGTLALWAAGRGRLPDGAPGSAVKVAVQGAISLAGVVDLAAADASGVGGDAVAQLLGGGEAEVPERIAVTSPAALVPLGVPQLLIHGLRDSVVPPSMSERYVERALEAGDDARYAAVPDAGHREMISPRGDAWIQASQQLETFFGR